MPALGKLLQFWVGFSAICVCGAVCSIKHLGIFLDLPDIFKFWEKTLILNTITVVLQV